MWKDAYQLNFLNGLIDSGVSDSVLFKRTVEGCMGEMEVVNKKWVVWVWWRRGTEGVSEGRQQSTGAHITMSDGQR
jgi:hypothetical protein